MIMSDSENSHELTDRILVSVILKISGLVLLIGPFFRDVRFLISAITFGINEVLLNSCLALAFTILIPAILLAFGDRIASIVTRQPIVIDTLFKASVPVAKSIGILLIATHVSPLCLSILEFHQLNSIYHNSDFLKYLPDRSVGNIIESGLSILLGIYLATGANWLFDLIIKRKQDYKPANGQSDHEAVS